MYAVNLASARRPLPARSRGRTDSASSVRPDSSRRLSFRVLRYVDDLERLPPHQRARHGDRFAPRYSTGRVLVGLATLTLSSKAAETAPLLIVVDDAQWLDRSSARVCAFVARRFEAESIAFLFARRDAQHPPEFDAASGADARGAFESLCARASGLGDLGEDLVLQRDEFAAPLNPEFCREHLSRSTPRPPTAIQPTVRRRSDPMLRFTPVRQGIGQ